jgi:hypothetical protein
VVVFLSHIPYSPSKALGLTGSQSFLAGADGVIE